MGLAERKYKETKNVFLPKQITQALLTTTVIFFRVEVMGNYTESHDNKMQKMYSNNGVWLQVYVKMVTKLKNVFEKS